MTDQLKKGITFLLNVFYPLFRKWMSFQVYAYLAVGAANTLLNILLFIVFYQFVLPQGEIEVLGFGLASYTIALVLAFILTVPTGFWLSKYFAFTDAEDNRKENTKQLGKYFLVVLQGLGSDYLLLKGLIVFTGMLPTAAKIVSTVIVVTVNYLLQKYFTFKAKQHPEMELM